MRLTEAAHAGGSSHAAKVMNGELDLPTDLPFATWYSCLERTKSDIPTFLEQSALLLISSILKRTGGPRREATVSGQACIKPAASLTTLVKA